MAITRVDTTVITVQPTASSITPAAPVGVEAGDVIVVAASVSKSGTTFSTTSYPGWIIVRDLVETSMVTRIMWRVATGSGDAPPAMGFTAAAGGVATAAAYRGVDTSGGPFLVEDGRVAPSTQTAHPAPALNNTNTGAWGVYAGHARQVASPQSWTVGAGLVELEDAEIGLSNSNNAAALWADSNGVVATGSVTYTATTSATTAQSAAWAGLLKAPASADVATYPGATVFPSTSLFPGSTTGGLTVVGATAAVSVDAPAGSLGGEVVVVGVTATVTVAAPAGAVLIVGPALIVGATAAVSVSASAGAVPTGQISLPARASDVYREALRSGFGLEYTVDAYYNGIPVTGATDLRPVGGSITDTTKPGVRRVLSLDLAPEPGLFDKLAPIGTQLKVTAQVTYSDRTSTSIPMGVFDVDSQRLGEGGGGLSLTAPDKWVRIQRARFIAPVSSVRGARVTAEITRLIRGALGALEEVVVTATSTATVGALVWEKDRDQAIIDLATSIGAWVFFDRDGVATVADVPTITQNADWLIDASASGVLTELDRERSRQSTYNVVVVESSAASGPKFTTQYVWDGEPSSPTYAGTNPKTNPGSAGPFGVVVYYHDSPIARDAVQARRIGTTILARTTGLASQVSLAQSPNPAMDAFDVLDVLPPRERYDIARVLERHVADAVTHPLTAESPLQVEGRSTRSDEYAVSS